MITEIYTLEVKCDRCNRTDVVQAYDKDHALAKCFFSRKFGSIHEQHLCMLCSCNEPNMRTCLSETNVAREALKDLLIAQGTAFGADGIRDPDYPCESFVHGVPSASCETDGHFLCKECKECNKERVSSECHEGT